MVFSGRYGPPLGRPHPSTSRQQSLGQSALSDVMPFAVPNVCTCIQINHNVTCVHEDAFSGGLYD